jgi:hypothetical protein
MPGMIFAFQPVPYDRAGLISNENIVGDRAASKIELQARLADVLEADHEGDHRSNPYAFRGRQPQPKVRSWGEGIQVYAFSVSPLARLPVIVTAEPDNNRQTDQLENGERTNLDPP